MKHPFSSSAAISVIMANMIGTGVFTSLGFQLVDIDSGFVLISLWVLGGLVALCGALSYAELGAALPRSGGEYHFLTQVFHPSLGFTSGWVSATVGFAAPVALAAMTFSAYVTSSVPALAGAGREQALAIALVISLAIAHSGSRQRSSQTQQMFTGVKIVVILGFCLGALVLVDTFEPVRFAPAASDVPVMLGPAFGVSLIYVSYAYTGWNVATYFSSELDDPQRTLPRVLLLGTAVVACLYVALNVVFLVSTPMDTMRGEIEIGFLVARSVFGETGAKLAGLTLALLLVSTVSAMTLAGPRVLHVIGQDYRLFRFIGAVNDFGVPRRAIWLQSLLSVVLILTASFQSILLFSGALLALNSFAAVLGLLVMRYRQPDLERPFRVPFFPLPPLIYLFLTGFSLVYVLVAQTAASLTGFAVVGLGLLVYFLLGDKPVASRQVER